MKIISSDVQMSAQTQTSIDVEVNSSMQFKQTLLGIVKEDGTTKPLEASQELDEIKAGVESIKEQIARLMLELILIQFLGIKPSKAKEMAQQQFCSCENSEPKEQTKLLAKTEFHFERSIEYERKASVEFNSTATLQTADGQEIDLDFKIGFTQEFYEKHEEAISFTEVGLIDPLVIQYSNHATAFDFVDEELTFLFDINSDGQNEQLPILKEGNGFLALDKNDNGLIDNGTELFGPQSNDGFSELEVYDEDQNGWIDEADSVFEDLKIYAMNEKGGQELLALGQAGIGAIFLKDVQSELNIHKSVQDPLAHLKSSSFYVKEDGSAGLLSSLDFIA